LLILVGFLSVLELSSDAFCDAAAHQTDDENNADDAEHDRREVILLRRRRYDCHVLSDRLHWLSLASTESTNHHSQHTTPTV